MCLERLDGSFSSVCTVSMRGNELKGCFVFFHGVFEVLRDFVVEDPYVGGNPPFV